MSDLLNFTEYARRLGVSQPAVSQAVKDGRLVRAVVEKDGRRMIDPAIADVEWSETTRVKVGSDSGPVSRETRHDIHAARAKRETHEANLAEMRERKAAGELVELSAVVKASTDAGARLRQDLDRLPGLATELAAETDPARIRNRLAAVVADALAEAVLALNRMADDASASHQ